MVDSEDEDYQHSVIDPKYDAVAAVLCAIRHILQGSSHPPLLGALLRK